MACLMYYIPYTHIVAEGMFVLVVLLLLGWKSDLTDKMKRSTWTLTKRLEKKLDGKYTRMLRAILNKS